MEEGSDGSPGRIARLFYRAIGYDPAAAPKERAAERARFVREARAVAPRINGFEDILADLDRGRR